MLQRVQKNFKDVLVYEKKFIIVFNNTEYLVFKERLENCCKNFSKKLRNMNKNNKKSNYMNFIEINDNVVENEKEEEESFVYEDKDIKKEIFSTFVKCINGEEIKIKEDNSTGLMILSIEFGYDRLKQECEEYISKEQTMIRKEIKGVIEGMINQNNQRKKGNNTQKYRQEERDFNESERIVGKYFNIAIEEENEMMKNLPIEMLNRIIHCSEFSIENLNEKQRHLFIELIIHQLKKEGKSASILMNGISIKPFSNSDIRVLLKEENFMGSTMRVGEDEIERMINNEDMLKEMKTEIEQLKEEIKEMKEKQRKAENEENERKEKELREKEIREKELLQIDEKDKEMKKELDFLKKKITNITEIKPKEIKKTDPILFINSYNKVPFSDRKGIFEYTKENSKTIGDIKIKGNSYGPYYQRYLPHIIEKNYVGVCWISENNYDSSFEIEFPNNVGILIDSYQIHSHDYNYRNSRHLRNWRIEGKKKNGEWIIIDEKKDNCELKDDHRENLFKPSRTQTESVISVRLINTGGNGHDDSIWIRNIEFFGKMA